MNLICFEVGGTIYGLDMENVMKLDQFKEVSLDNLPDERGIAMGVLEFEGKPVVIYDADGFLGDEKKVSEWDVVIYLGRVNENGSTQCYVGVRVTVLREVLSGVDPELIRDVVGKGSMKGGKFVKGMLKSDFGEVAVIDVEGFVDSLIK